MSSANSISFPPSDFTQPLKADQHPRLDSRPEGFDLVGHRPGDGCGLPFGSSPDEADHAGRASTFVRQRVQAIVFPSCEAAGVGTSGT